MPELDIDNLFRYHPPSEKQHERYSEVRRRGSTFARRIQEICPDSAERTLAIRKLQEVVMWANASIAVNE